MGFNKKLRNRLKKRLENHMKYTCIYEAEKYNYFTDKAKSAMYLVNFSNCVKFQ